MTDKQQPPSSVPYARVHPIDEGRVEEIRQRNDKRKKFRNAGDALLVATTGDIDYLLSLIPVSSSERRCGECGHVDAIDPHGRCMSVYYDAGGSLVYCGCKCVFPASTKETAEQFERDFAAWQRKVNESIEATRQSEILTAEDFNIRINARADDPALAMAPAPKEHIVECGVWTDPNAACTCIESDTPTAAATAEIDRLTSELKAVQERAASEISELAVAVTDLKFELYNAGFEIEQLNAEVERLRNQRDSARANAINEALIAVEDLRKAYPESLRAYLRDIYSTWLSLRLSLSSKKNPVSKSER
jgi:outer membrane murein-binding lipoprotein Lpp